MEKSLSEKVLTSLENKQYDGKDFVVQIASKEGKKSSKGIHRKTERTKETKNDLEEDVNYSSQSKSLAFNLGLISIFLSEISNALPLISITVFPGTNIPPFS